MAGFAAGSLAFLLSFVSAYLSSAPFTPAVIVIVLTLPLAAFAIYRGARRTGWLAVYWSGCAILASYTLQNASRAGDKMLLFAYAFGLVLTLLAFIYYLVLRYRRRDTKNTTPK